MTCPVCGRPFPPVPPWRERRRVTCSRSCNGARSKAIQLAALAALPFDAAAVYRLTHGQPVASTKAERVEATALLRARGRSYSQIADALHVDPRSVARYVVLLRHPRKATP